MTSLFYPSISPEEGEPNNEVIPSKEFKYQLKSQILSGIKNEREICYTHKSTEYNTTNIPFYNLFIHSGFRCTLLSSLL